jgi:hypothetical protein
VSIKPSLFKLGLFVAAVAFTGVFFINWCDLIYQCGCTFLWAGGAEHCNIHNPEPPHCPWCANHAAGGTAFLLTIAAQAVVVWQPGPVTTARAAAALAASPVAAGIAGAAIGLAASYWSV